MGESEVSDSQDRTHDEAITSERVSTQQSDPARDEEHPDTDVVSDDTAAGHAPDEPADPGVGGYGGRDPKTDMPRMPSVPETQDDPLRHDAAPDPDGKRRPAHS